MLVSFAVLYRYAVFFSDGTRNMHHSNCVFFLDNAFYFRTAFNGCAFVKTYRRRGRKSDDSGTNPTINIKRYFPTQSHRNNV